jgi:DNA invertase Pin-like site-specific DNA recombinase
MMTLETSNRPSQGFRLRIAATGKLVLNVLDPVAQFEHQLLIERTMAGLTAARVEGRTGGNRRRMSPQDIAAARRHMTENKLKAREVYSCRCSRGRSRRSKR